MRIAFDGSALGSGRGGDETSLVGILNGLADATPPHVQMHYRVYLRRGASLPDRAAEHPSFSVRHVPRLPSPVHYAVLLPHIVASDSQKPDLLYSVTHAPFWSPVPSLLHLHDLSFRLHPEHYRRSTRLRLNLLVPLHARQARVIITPSEMSRQHIMAAYGIPGHRVFVVPNAIEQPPAAAADDEQTAVADLRALGIRGRFFLYVGNLHPRKNVARLIEAFVQATQETPKLADHQLVIAGGRWWGHEEERAAAHAVPGTVLSLGRISDAQRNLLMRNAVALAYPSLFEGFGLPPLEAMLCGTPVLASNVSAMPEVLGDAALLVDPMSVRDIANGLTQIALDARMREQLRERGTAQAKRYTALESGRAALRAFDAVAPVDPEAMRWSRSIDSQSASIPRSSATRSRRFHNAARTRRNISCTPCPLAIDTFHRVIACRHCDVDDSDSFAL